MFDEPSRDSTLLARKSLNLADSSEKQRNLTAWSSIGYKNASQCKTTREGPCGTCGTRAGPRSHAPHNGLRSGTGRPVWTNCAALLPYKRRLGPAQHHMKSRFEGHVGAVIIILRRLCMTQLFVWWIHAGPAQVFLRVVEAVYIVCAAARP